MRRLAIFAPLGGALCLIAAAYLIARRSRRDVQEIYGMINRYTD